MLQHSAILLCRIMTADADYFTAAQPSNQNFRCRLGSHNTTEDSGLVEYFGLRLKCVHKSSGSA